MDKLIQTIQDEINNLMNSKSAKLTDNKLESLEKSTVATKDLVQKIIQEYYNSNRTLRQICGDYDISLSTFKRQRKSYGLEIKTGEKHNTTNLVQSIKTKNQIDEKTKDIQSGMTWKEYQLKWGVAETAYYRLKRKLKKDLVD
jgi:hypothetical protein